MNSLVLIIALCQGGEQACARFVKRLGLEIHLVLEGAEEIAARYQVSTFPTAVVIDAKQKIRAYGHPKNVEDLARLLAHSLGPNSINPEAAEKSPLPVFSSGTTQ